MRPLGHTYLPPNLKDLQIICADETSTTREVLESVLEVAAPEKTSEHTVIEHPNALPEGGICMRNHAERLLYHKEKPKTSAKK
jgi:hypothetical protein